MNDLLLVSDFFIQNKINFKDIKYKKNGPTDEFTLIPYPTTNIKKIFGLTKNLGLVYRSKAEPRVEHNYSDGIIKISILKRSIDTLNIKNSVSLSKETVGLNAPICMGIKDNGVPLVIDQSSIPNTIIGGSPGSGKSTLLHNMIVNLLANNVNVSLIDPKSTEFNLYRDAKNCERVVDDMDNVPDLLSHFIKTMNQRYSLLKRYGCQSATDLNIKLGQKSMIPQVLIIDEWADLYLANKNIVNDITSLAQKGRAAGISIILATQRPSSQVLPGIIKASFSGRVALKCSSSLESRIIMDISGAEDLNRGVAYYMDQSNLNPVLFSVPYSSNLSEDIVDLGIKSKKSNVFSLFNYVFG